MAFIKHVTAVNVKDKDFMTRWYQSVQKAFTGGISFGEAPLRLDVPVKCVNIDGNLVITISGVADTEFIVTHNLNRIPIGFDVKRTDKACSVYDSGTAWTKTQIFLKCSIATVKMTLFIH